MCQTPACQPSGWQKECEIDNTVYGCTFCKTGVAGFGHSSVVAFLPANSSATGTIADSQFTSTIDGELLFEYQTDSLGSMQVMRLNRMVLNLSPFETEIGEFTDVIVSLEYLTAAKCQDQPAPVATPCAKYQIPTGEFWCSESCRIDGDPVAFSSNTSAPLDIHLDPTTQTFTITGSLQSTAMVDGEEFDIDVTLNLEGQVLNYAPNAAAGFEGDDHAECSDAINQAAVYLYAGDSFDVDDGTLPTGGFEWYEDYGLVTETYWGAGQTLKIDAGQLGYGVHHFTLVVTDSQGVLDTDDIDVTVADTAPPHLEVPEDVVLYVAFPPPVQVDLGEAFAGDACLPIPDDAITNDAPADLRFDAGETLVTWQADDGRGNVATQTQKVTVFALSGPSSLLDAIRLGLVELQEIGSQDHADISECEPAQACPVDLGPFVASADGLLEFIQDMAPEDGAEADDYAAILADVEGARNDVLEAAGPLDESNAEEAEPDAAVMLREQALGLLEDALAKLDGAAARVDVLEAEMATDDVGDGSSLDGEGGGGQVPFPLGNGAPCVLTTVLRGSPLQADLGLFRAFRDRHLLTNAPGRWLVAGYYRVSPPLARVCARHEALRDAGRAVLTPIVRLLKR